MSCINPCSLKWFKRGIGIWQLGKLSRARTDLSQRDSFFQNVFSPDWQLTSQSASCWNTYTIPPSSIFSCLKGRQNSWTPSRGGDRRGDAGHGRPVHAVALRGSLWVCREALLSLPRACGFRGVSACWWLQAGGGGSVGCPKWILDHSQCPFLCGGD